MKQRIYSCRTFHKSFEEEVRAYFHESGGEKMFTAAHFKLNEYGIMLPTSNGITVSTEYVNDLIKIICNSAKRESSRINPLD